MIELIKINELNAVIEIFKDVTKDMIKKGINQWDSIYPDYEALTKDINDNHAYGYYNNNNLIAYISINEHFAKNYETINWQYFDSRPLIIHRLAVKSKFQGHGIAKKMMCFAEHKAQLEGYSTIRLDAFSKNPYALKLYKSLSYKYVGDVRFRKGIFYCFEKKIDAI